MVEQGKQQSVGVRYGAYVDELREFFASRDVSFGSPQDLVEFGNRVTEPGPFQDEMGSMVRTILFHEGESLGRGELLELVAVAVGGTEVETAAQEMHASVRQVFVFVNSALRQRAVPEEFAAAGAVPRTAGDILAATQAWKEAEETAVTGRSSDRGFQSGPDGEPEADHERSRDTPGGSGILFKAVTMAESENGREFREGLGEPPTDRRWLVPAVVGIVLAVGGGTYLARTGLTHPGTGSGPASAGLGSLQAGQGTAGSCVSAPAASASRSGLQERSRWAHKLLDQKLYEAALPELREVARIDPGFPGINLDESDALLQLKRPEDARDAVDTQINISECLAKLPSAALDAYCAAEFSASADGGCRPQLAHIQQAAELQAALVHLELGHRAIPDSGASEPTLADSDRVTDVPPPVRPRAAAPSGATPLVRSHREGVFPPATEGDTGRPAVAHAASPAKPATGKSGAKKSNGDDSLMRGEGTDSALGAYSKPQ